MLEETYRVRRLILSDILRVLRNTITFRFASRPLHATHTASLPTKDVALRHTADLVGLLQTARQDGSLHPQAADIAVRALAFGKLRVVDVMVPRNRICALSVHAPMDTITRTLLEDGHSRMPVYDQTLDNIVGILVAKDVLALAWEKSLIVLQDLLQPPYFAPDSMFAADLLKELQTRRLHFAIVVDELGGTIGIVTLEDLLEELVGDIFGEHDLDAPELMHRQADGTVMLQGAMPIREANHELHLTLPEGEAFSTVGGLCVSLAGRIPDKGHQLACGNGTTLEVIDVSPRSVRMVRLRRTLPIGSEATRDLKAAG